MAWDADALIRARLQRSFDDVAARAAATAPGLGASRRHRRGLAPLGAAVLLAATVGAVGAVLVHRGAIPSRLPAAHPPVVTSPSPSPSAVLPPPVPKLSGVTVGADLDGGVLVFGGSTRVGGTLLDPQTAWTDQTWRWKDGAWTQLHPAQSPSPRTRAILVADPAAAEVVLFGGVRYNPPGADIDLTDTWTWDGAAWVERHPRHHPGLLGMDPLAAYDGTTRQVLVLDDSGVTWTWDGVDWTQRRDPSGPQSSGAGMMAWDPVTRTVILADAEPVPATPDPSPMCCGVHGNLAEEEATWSWTGSTWVRLHPRRAAGMIDRFGVASRLAPDPAGGLIALLGNGGKAGPQPPDVLHWDGRTWSVADATDAPIGSDGLVMTSDGHLLNIDLGGVDEGDHPVAEWTGARWAVLKP